MLRHLKMKRQQDDVAEQQVTGITMCQQQQQQQQYQSSTMQQSQVSQPAVRRVRGRRSSKPMMEKRRRARINQCLDTLKSYVLTDPSSLNKLGIDTSASENQDEETIARTILKSSGLINRHRGRKNPNKLEKADILELTVDYVRQLHEQRDHWISVVSQLKQHDHQQQRQAPVAIATPLSLNLPVRAANQATPPSPPPSSASSSPQPLLSISSNIQTCADVLDLSGKRVVVATNNQQHLTHRMMSIYKDSISPPGESSIGNSWSRAYSNSLICSGDLLKATTE